MNQNGKYYLFFQAASENSNPLIPRHSGLRSHGGRGELVKLVLIIMKTSTSSRRKINQDESVIS